MTFNSFHFAGAFIGCFNKHDCNCYDAGKIDYIRSSHKGILKQRLWHHNFSPWRHEQNFIT